MPNKKGNFVYLLVGLLTMLLATAVTQQLAGTLVQVISLMITALGLGISIFSISNHRKLFQIAIAIIMIEIGVGVASQFIAISVLHILDLLLLGMFFFGMTTIVFQQVLFAGPIDNNRIVGAICIYLLLGFLWAVCYTLLFLTGLGSFNGLGNLDQSAGFTDLIYFSFVTLSTLGYGDISPITPIARFFVYMEALTGQFYLAILVASLIGARFSMGKQEQ